MIFVFKNLKRFWKTSAGKFVGIFQNLLKIILISKISLILGKTNPLHLRSYLPKSFKNHLNH